MRIKKPCKDTHVRNPASGRCVLKSKRTGKIVLASKDKWNKPYENGDNIYTAGRDAISSLLELKNRARKTSSELDKIDIEKSTPEQKLKTVDNLKELNSVANKSILKLDKIQESK